MVAKSLSNDFRFEDAVAMQETSCGNYEATVNIADGEEFGFYLYPIRNATDIATVLDDGRLCCGNSSN